MFTWRAIALATALMLSVPAMAQEMVKLELNKLEPHDNSCRVYFVLTNENAAAFSELTLDLVIFDHDGIIQRHLAFEGAPLPDVRTRVKLFELDAMSCPSVGHILFNGVLYCGDQNGARDDCLDVIAPSSRAAVALQQ